MTRVPFALQLYTVRDQLQADPAGTLERIRGFGYDHIEVAGTAGLPAAEFRRIADANGLGIIGMFAGFDQTGLDVSPLAETAHILGLQYILFSAERQDRDGWLKVAETIDRAGADLRHEGLQLCYHNHAHEFERFDGTLAYDILMANTDSKNVAAEIDVYWAQFGGTDPIELIGRYAGRCPLIHMKDMSADASRTFAEVGQGILDMAGILSVSAKAGAKWYIVEQDVCPGDPFESVRISAEYMAQARI